MSAFQSWYAVGEPFVGEAGWQLPLNTGTLIARPHAEGVWALEFRAEAPLPASPAALAPELAASAFRAEATGDGYRLSAEGLSLVVALAPLAVRLEAPDGATLWGPCYAGTLAAPEGPRFSLMGSLAEADEFFGLGEKPGYLGKRGRRYTMWNTDNTGPHVETHDTLYQSIPWLLTRHEGRAAGLLFDDPGKTRFDLGADEPDVWRYVADGAGLRLFPVGGPSQPAVVRRYASLTGRLPLPPLWALGYHQSRWSYGSARELETLAAEFRARRIPCDVLHLDIDYMDGYRIFTWSPERFGEPEARRATFERLRAHGFRPVTIVDPGIKREPGYAPYDDCVAGGFAVRLAGSDEPFVGEVWPGACVFPDFHQAGARRWWGALHAELLDAGVAGIWNDMNEPSVFRGPGVPREEQTMPENARHGDENLPHRQAHNTYGLEMSRATREGLEALRPDARAFVISRAGYAGIQRYATVWTGDNHSLWAHLEQGLAMCLNLGLSGVPFVGPDVGGFSGDCTAELLVRWSQVGAFLPFFRNHSATGTRRQEPWAFDERTEELVREAIERRYRFLPLLYTAFYEAATEGLPVMRPMSFATAADEPETASIFDQFLVGNDLLVAPIVRPGATHRLVYFPAGAWEDLATGETRQGPGYQVVSAPLDTIPLFGRASAVLPLGPVRQHTGEPLEALSLWVGAGEHVQGRWVEDDGESLGYARGELNDWRFEGRRDAEGLTLAIRQAASGYASPTARFEVSLPETSGVARFEGEVVPARAAGDRLLVSLPARAGTLKVNLT